MKVYIRNPFDARKDITRPCTIHQQSISTIDSYPYMNFTTLNINNGKIVVSVNRWKYKDYYSRKVPKK